MRHAPFKRNVGFAAQTQVFQIAVGEFIAAVAAFGAAGKVFGQAAVGGAVVADIRFGVAPIPGAGVGEGEVAAVEAGGFRADKAGA